MEIISQALEMLGQLLGKLGIVGVIFAVIFCVAWVVLPFAVFGIGHKLDTIISLLKKRQNE